MLAALGAYDRRPIRRLTQEDPLGLAGGLNLYGYANGDPVTFSDPFGLCPEWWDGIPCVTPYSGWARAASGPPPSGAGGSEWGQTRYSGESVTPDVWHNGLDGAGALGTGIAAPGGGTATTGTDAQSGLYVRVDLGNGFTVSFSHLSDVPGQFKTADGTIDHSLRVKVNAGDVMGFIGQTGNAKVSGREPHAHIVTKHGDKDCNPRDFYSKSGGAGTCQ